ncbi:hypothetical protein GF314_00755 [bacterium]|nr:hypothetical protein [bacterium]
MNDRCLGPEEITAARAAGPDHPARRHLDRCAWCQALAASVDLFDAPGDLPAGADTDDAAARLDAMLAREVAGEHRRAGEAAGPARGGPAAPDRTPRWRRRALPVAVAAATLALALLGIDAARDLTAPAPPEVRLRGEAGERSDVVLETPRVLDDGGVLLVWTTRVAGASYTIELVDGEQELVRQLDAGARTRLRLAPAVLDSLGARPGPWFAVVVATRDRDEIARSLPRAIPTSGAQSPQR